MNAGAWSKRDSCRTLARRPRAIVRARVWAPIVLAALGMSPRLRRPALFLGVAGIGVLVSRRVHANRDPSELSIGGSAGAQDSHLTCGPDVRVRHASGGFHYERVFEDEHHHGNGALIDVRAGLGTTTITEVAPTDENASSLTKATDLYDHEAGKSHFLATAQMTAGWDWGVYALTGGIGYFGLADVTDDQKYFRAHYYPLPTLDMRIGRRKGISGNLGMGAPPIPGLARWWSFYGMVQWRFVEGVEIGGGLIGVPISTLDTRSGVLFKGSVPVTPWLSLGGFGVVDIGDKSRLSGFNWTAGGGATFVLDSLEP